MDNESHCVGISICASMSDSLSALVCGGGSAYAPLATLWSMLSSRDAMHCLRCVSKAFYKSSSQHIRVIHIEDYTTTDSDNDNATDFNDDVESRTHYHHHIGTIDDEVIQVWAESYPNLQTLNLPNQGEITSVFNHSMLLCFIADTT